MDLGKVMKKKVEEAVEKAPKLGLSRVDWDCAFGWGPNPQGQMVPAYWVAVTTPSNLLGQHVATLVPIVDAHADPKVVDQMIANAIDQLRAQKARETANLNGGGGQIG